MKHGIANSLILAAALLTLHACGGGIMAPDALIEDPGAEAFLDRVGKNCGKLSIGNQQLSYLLDDNNDDTYFVDVSSKLYFGETTKSQYTDDINSFYPTDANQPALNCIFTQLDGG